MDVDLPVLDGVEEVLDVVFIGERSAVSLKPTVDFFTFGRVEEFGTKINVSGVYSPGKRTRYSRLGVVVDDPVSREC